MKLFILILITFLFVLTLTQDSAIMTILILTAWVCSFILCIIDIKETRQNKFTININL